MDVKQALGLASRISLSRRQIVIAATVFGALALVGALVYRLSPEGSFFRDETGRAADGRRMTPVVRKGKAIFIPDGSPYRAHIAVAPVEIRNVSLSRVVPGTVEADPARTVRVLAPVNGRVSELNVELGDNVTRGQPLATIDSGDLAQAVADAEKARASAKLTKSALDRATGLNKAGGLALRELEQAQNDFLQATSELKRAEARLDVIGDNSKLTGQRK
ncbi:MAG: biotin/lipoyl-binding protein, partial [Alphaproteobacteria bacterium]|nr:biotin/lipoyl-binding protein [Alphaproteobacteria bacterium]